MVLFTTKQRPHGSKKRRARGVKIRARFSRLSGSRFSKKLSRYNKAASALTTRLFEKPTEKNTDVSVFWTKGLKAADGTVRAAVDREICAKQAEKLRIFAPTSRMDCLDHCKANLDALILATAEKYLLFMPLVNSR